MSLVALPISVSDLTTLQSGLEFFTNPAEATSEATPINTPGSPETVFTYAARLLQNNFLLSQVAMAVDGLMFGQTDTLAELTKLCTQFLPPQAAIAVVNGFNPTVYASEALGLALAGGNGSSNNFATNFGSLSISAFAQATANATGVNATAIQGFAQNWISFYTANPSSTFGLSATLASYGAAFGDAVGVALLNDTSAKLKTDIDLNSDVLLSGAVANALIDNAEGLYRAGVPLGSLPVHQLLQGESTTLNLVGAAGTIDMAILPPTIETLNYQTPANGSVTIINQNNPLTVNLEDNTVLKQMLTVVGAVGLNDSLEIKLGNPLHLAKDHIGFITVTGDELFKVTALGADNTDVPIQDITGLITLTPSPGGNEEVTLAGNTSIIYGAIADATGDILNIDDMIIDVSNSRTTELGGINTPLLDFVTDAGANGGKFAPSISYSTNAMTIDASTSGGLIMFAGDANFNAVTGSGDIITGAAQPVGTIVYSFEKPVGDILVGSIGNDTLTSKSLTLPDYIYTNGGADTITLPAGHLGADHVGFYAADTRFNDAAELGSAAASISEDNGGSEFVNPGWWGIAAGGSSTKIVGGELFGGVATGTGTSADNSQLFGFVPGQDFLDFSLRAWNGGLGLARDTGNGLAGIPIPFGTDTGTFVYSADVYVGGSMSGGSGVNAGLVDFIVLRQSPYANAAALGKALHDGSYTIGHSLLLGGDEADFLVAYEDLDGNARIADLHLKGHAAGILAGSISTDHDESVYVSDIVTLVGVRLAMLDATLLQYSSVHLVT